MDFKNILWENREGIGILTLNREDVRNALKAEMREDIGAAMRAAEDDRDVRLVIITGRGEKVFCAGGDIKAMADNTMWDILARKADVFTQIHQCTKPVIAAINGLALGGGCELAMACDFRVGSENARLGQPEINLGIFPGGGATQRLQRLIGPGRAKEMIFTGDIIDAREAERIGLLNKVFPAGELMEKTLEIARKICSKGPLALKLAKMSMNMGMEAGLAIGLGYERLARTLVHGSEDRVEGMHAFLEKRKPEFKGK
ncbi:MAG TPA: enoyl-CoA hydratase-related protein [Thermodesulfobacteriota bacterium]|nr:enoyl-CoA hydratase-related protein [Thermodesulfobacteriota bacterium]